MQMFTKEPVIINTWNVIWNLVSDKKCSVVNFICLFVKQYIYRKRCQGQDLKIQEIQIELKQQESIEKFYATRNSTVSKHNKKWNRISPPAQK